MNILIFKSMKDRNLFAFKQRQNERIDSFDTKCCDFCHFCGVKKFCFSPVSRITLRWTVGEKLIVGGHASLIEHNAGHWVYVRMGSFLTKCDTMTLRLFSPSRHKKLMVSKKWFCQRLNFMLKHSMRRLFIT